MFFQVSCSELSAIGFRQSAISSQLQSSDCPGKLTADSSLLLSGMRYLLVPVCSLWFLPIFAADDLPPGAGGAVAAKTCTVCHGVDNIRQKRLSRDDWADVVDEMIDRGAKLTDREKETVLSYLAESLGPNSKLWVNSAPLAEWKAVAGLTVPEAKAVIEYRKQNGDFHQIGDLLKVPGVDPRKIEAKKDVFAF